MTILGISIGTTRTGVCVLKDDVLLDRHIHNYRSAWSDHKLRVIVNRYKQYILKHNVSAIIIKIPPPRKHTKPVTQILKRLEGLAREYYIDFDLITRTEIKHVTNVRSTTELIKYTTLLYPELKAVYDNGTKKDSYYKKVYEAILCAHIFRERQQSRAQQQANTI